MIIKGSNYIPAPEGMHDAVCVDFHDLGLMDTQFGKKHKCIITFELSCPMEDGRPFTVSQRFNVSLHEKAGLRKFLKSWRGRDFTKEELDGFDTENVINAPAQIVIAHAEKDGTVYGNIATILKADPARKLKPSGKFVRRKDRPENAGNGHDDDAPPDDGSLPF